jgi:Family of unknown function (DUF5677)
LHGIAVIGLFIKERGNDIAERYLLHDAVECYKAARQYQQYSAALGYEPLSDEEFRKIKLAYDRLLSRFGSSFKSDYGWAASILGKTSPTFRDIEESINLDHVRPFYKMASHNVHGNPRGVFFKLGLYPETQDVLLAGPSNIGLADPCHHTAISLCQITIALLATRPNLDRLVLCNLLLRLADEIGHKFLEAHRSLAPPPV